ncbi:hypothetical protein MKX03_009285 [Papaver bracteatum]|nr:hypothetical protein MKX03_009285 [Papaver bracteatum]
MAGSGSEEVKILGGWPSPFVMRPRIALNIKSVKYDFLEETFGSKSELLLKSNPIYKKMPVMIHGDKPICESMIIVQYIDDVWASSGHSIIPSDPYDASIARFWATYIDDKFFPSLMGIAKSKDAEEKKAAIEQAIAVFGILEEAYQKTSKGKDFFGGEKIGYIDIALGCYVGWIRVTEKMNGIKLFDEEKVPGLTKWVDKFCADEIVKSVMPETDALMEFAKKIFGSKPPPSN